MAPVGPAFRRPGQCRRPSRSNRVSFAADRSSSSRFRPSPGPRSQAIAKSQYQQALLVYRQAIQHAFGDVSDALINYQKLQEVRQRQEDTVADLVESVGLSERRYKAGTTIYLESSTASAPCSPPN